MGEEGPCALSESQFQQAVRSQATDFSNDSHLSNMPTVTVDKETLLSSLEKTYSTCLS